MPFKKMSQAGTVSSKHPVKGATGTELEEDDPAQMEGQFGPKESNTDNLCKNC